MKRDERGFITELSDKEVFVFASNLAGKHAGGAAKTALDKFNASYGRGVGIQGDSYAIPTLDKNFKKLPLEAIHNYIYEFAEFTKRHPEVTFFVTPIGTGIAGFTAEEIAPLFKGCLALENVVLPVEFTDILTE